MSHMYEFYKVVGERIPGYLRLARPAEWDPTLPASVDPINYELFRHALYQALDEGKQTMQRVGVSPVIRDCGEVAYAVYTAEGDLALSATGILFHLVGISWAIKSILRFHKDDILEDDQWFMNDPQLGGMHACDQAVMAPVFYAGELIAWLSCMTHTPEVGAIDPGGMSPRSAERYHDGVMYPCVRIVRGGEPVSEIMRMMALSVRDPNTITMDNLSKVAGNNRGKQRVIELAQRFGVNFVRAALKKLIVDSEALARQKIRQFEDGEYFNRQYMDNDTGGNEKIWWIQCTARKRGDQLTLDFAGTSPPNPTCGNAAPPGAVGGIFTALCGHLFYDIPWNSGLLNAIEILLPEGCVINVPPHKSVSNAPQISHLTAACVHGLLNRLRLASGVQKEFINAQWPPCGGLWCVAGSDQFGRPFASYTLDYMASGMGASPLRDGCDTGAVYYGPESDGADVEAWERYGPILYLGRSQTRDSFGLGRFRGGASIETVQIVHKPGSETETILGPLGGSGRRISMTPGLGGAYPAPLNYLCYIDGASVYDAIRSGERLPHRTDELEEWAAARQGDHIIKIMSPFFSTPPGRVYGMRIGGGGGYGDPLRRDPERVREDIDEELLSPETAAAVFGVVLGPDGSVDTEATEVRRQEIRRERLSRGHVPAERRARR